jgi:hypothetical protein
MYVSALQIKPSVPSIRLEIDSWEVEGDISTGALELNISIAI